MWTCTLCVCINCNALRLCTPSSSVLISCCLVAVRFLVPLYGYMHHCSPCSHGFSHHVVDAAVLEHHGGITHDPPLCVPRQIQHLRQKHLLAVEPTRHIASHENRHIAKVPQRVHLVRR